MKLVFRIEHKNPRWRTVLENAISELRKAAELGDVMVTLADVLRSLDQNAKQWPMLRDIAGQVPMTINGVPQRASEKDWKAVMTAAFGEETRFAVGLDGRGLVALGAATSEFSKAKFSDYIEFLYAAGSERGVEWSEKAKEHYERYRARRAA